MGPQRGTITFVDNNGSLSGTIRAMGETNDFTGSSNGNTFRISGVLNAGFLRIRYTAQGTVSGNTLRGTATTSAGVFQMSGTKTG
ncbi:hypothetical protein DRA42_06015 [Ethanoligenens harbinense]|nr:hypothetical protein CXQ68_05995 [Ethanoligenens harbinense YUAN-3]AYF40040.1 hypothetical protein CXP51_05855 [Ethanoligenens harbinense]AYF42872.1 hypothetical protein CN246_05995 [Ethanoligenens harbinense]QCN93634.1 hypothetical protein DRA42_06015 [Ethanoligenens harbinense]